MNHYREDYLKFPLFYCTNYFWCTYDKKIKTFLYGVFYKVIYSGSDDNGYGWWWFVVWLTDERRLALFPARTIARDPHHRESLTRGEQDNIANGKDWRKSSLIRNLLNVKHYAPYKSTKSKYQIIKILANCFQKMNCYSLIKLTPISIHLKYWHYNFPRLEFPCLPHCPCHILS